jgi:hypothetical protein
MLTQPIVADREVGPGGSCIEFYEAARHKEWAIHFRKIEEVL